MKELLQVLLKPETEDEESLRLMLIITIVMITTLVTYAILFPISTLDEATHEILEMYPECLGEIEVQEKEWVGHGSTGTNYYAVCEKAGVSIHIRGPR